MASPRRTFDTTSILNIVNLLRADTASASFLFDTAENPFSGGQCLIYVVGFPDGTTWGVRIPAHASHLLPEVVTNEVKNEVSILKHLETAGFSWSPRVIGYDCSFNNLLEYPYMVLTWVHGKPLKWSDSVPVRREDRRKVLSQMANIILELAESTRETSSTTALGYLTDKIDRKIVRVSRGQVPNVQLRDCFVQRALVRSKVVHSALDEQPYMVTSHSDLAGQNIIVDDEYNIKGIIDWGFACQLPLQFAVGLPRFLEIEPRELDPPTSPVDLLAFSFEFLQLSPVRMTDREDLIGSLPQSEAGIVPRTAHTVLSAPDVDWRNLMYQAAGSKGLHKWMAGKNWLLSRDTDIPTNSDLEREVEEFLEGPIGRIIGLSSEQLFGDMYGGVLDEHQYSLIARIRFWAAQRLVM
ncbi:hypothetical protein FQN54_008691 [Arachnomyces sp. PD_36]|nr:hypothetical protein FQN54_008691 [Arachnomyces sp. PD_36]